MKKTIISASTAVLAAIGFASAQDIEYNLSADVSLVCGITAASTTIAVDFGDLAGTPAANTVQSATSDWEIACNDPDGATVKFESANEGKLRRNGTEMGDGNEIAYKANVGSGAGKPFDRPPLGLANPIEISRAGSADLRNGLATDVRFSVNGVKGADTAGGLPTTTVYAGNFTDVVTLSVAAN